MTSTFGERTPPFGVKAVRICNVGVIDDVSITLQNLSALAICAGNGIGKTTILEAISLLGHLPCLPTLERSELRIRPSEIIRKWPRATAPDYAYYGGLVDPEELKRIGIDSWMESHRPTRGSNYGMVEFRVFDTCGDARFEHRFVVLVHSCRRADPGAPRLTDILSRGDFDKYGAGGVRMTDDRLLDSCGIILYDRSDQKGGQSLADYIGKLALGRTFHLHDRRRTESRIEAFTRADFPGIDGPRAVAYLNTDLNDFGRGNDLRESPKDLKRNFGSEMVRRLRVQFKEDGSFEHLAQLRRICASVLQTPLTHYSARNVLPADFYLMNIRKFEDGAEVSVSRLDGREPVDVNFLSAGENEVFFVTLVALNSVNNPALGPTLILLDEPDLHIANVARSRFFSEILDIVDGRSQLILSTHSAALFNVLRKKCRTVEDKVQVVFRTVERLNPLETRLCSKFDHVFLGRMRSIDSDSNPIARLWHGFTAFFWLQVAWTEASMPGESAFSRSVTLVALAIASLVSLMLIALSALFVDSTVGQTTDTFTYHKWIVGALGADLLMLISSAATITVFRRRARKAHHQLVNEVKHPLRELIRTGRPREM